MSNTYIVAQFAGPFSNRITPSGHKLYSHLHLYQTGHQDQRSLSSTRSPASSPASISRRYRSIHIHPVDHTLLKDKSNLLWHLPSTKKQKPTATIRKLPSNTYIPRNHLSRNILSRHNRATLSNTSTLSLQRPHTISKVSQVSNIFFNAHKTVRRARSNQHTRLIPHRIIRPRITA